MLVALEATLAMARAKGVAKDTEAADTVVAEEKAVVDLVDSAAVEIGLEEEDGDRAVDHLMGAVASKRVPPAWSPNRFGGRV
mmetsp:Transcript_9793/g.17303  ORF Transcript_9793/g.17303 Transcript_9793/m.17303 type:complete len:82 (-) Transcript_9793:433-678(-)